jgi:hypothetical protein
VALVLALMAMTVLMALGAALVLITSTETMMAGNFQNGRLAFYAAEAAAELAVAELRSHANWTSFVDGTERSRFVDGAPGGRRSLPIGAPVDLTAIWNLANCAMQSPCAGPPRWQLFAYGPLRDFLPGATDSPFYVVALIALAEEDPAGRAVSVRGEAFGPRGAHSAIELTAMPAGPGAIETGRTYLIP